MHTASPDDSQQTFGEALAGVGLGAEADLAPLHGRPDGTFGNIVSRLDTFIFEEGKEVLPVGQCAFGPGFYLVIVAALEDLAVIAHPFAHGSGIEP